NEVFIGEYVVIEEGSTIGDHTYIGHGTVIKYDTKIGPNAKIGSNCVIGGVGFGYEKDSNGKYAVIPHVGNVVIEEGVEVGNCTTIDRAVMGST
ncbi:MAG: UDP-3-O-(3-hydroxymyristoyl)glucosamine N-acyltransferase, partial [Saprospiraceae bacterium]